MQICPVISESYIQGATSQSLGVAAKNYVNPSVLACAEGKSPLTGGNGNSTPTSTQKSLFHFHNRDPDLPPSDFLSHPKIGAMKPPSLAAPQ